MGSGVTVQVIPGGVLTAQIPAIQNGAAIVQIPAIQGPPGAPGGGGGGLLVESVTSNRSLTAGRLYVCSGGIRLILTLTAGSTGDRVQVVAASAPFQIAQSAGVQCTIGDLNTTLGITGRIDSVNLSDAIELVCLAPGYWQAFILNGYLEVT